ncbi:Putative transposase [Erwinia tasmaniensis Et1/99]|uniref:Transposase n=1 Tax=Erwinia tasmaniensis (strain DSM 17950 / CFBP 7177 / CIP 109463 / NCPPB 4357 / Et1/99) TaxID=465817 RepID=B2VGL5_ERWT9|nr:Putative transposase [Erwinia tasmaniensis Et1/99]
MKKSRFTEEQNVFAPKQAGQGASVPDVCRKLGISDATFYTWRGKRSTGGAVSGVGFWPDVQEVTSIRNGVECEAGLPGLSPAKAKFPPQKQKTLTQPTPTASYCSG